MKDMTSYEAEILRGFKTKTDLSIEFPVGSWH